MLEHAPNRPRLSNSEIWIGVNPNELGRNMGTDVKVSAADALTTAEKLAAEKLASKDSQP